MKLFSLLITCFVLSTTSLAINSPNHKVTLSYLVDESMNIDTSNIEQQEFIPSSKSIIHLGFQSHPAWVKIDIESERPYRNLKLRIAKPLFDSLCLYHKTDAQWTVDRKGIKIPNNPSTASGYYFNVSIDKGKNTFYVKGSSDYSHIYQISLETHDQSERLNLIKQLINGSIIGVYAIMFLFNIFLSFSLEDKVYRYYSFHAIFVMIGMLALQGFWNQDLLGLNSFTGSFLIVLSVNLVSIAAAIFCINFLKLKESMRPMYWVLIGICVFDVIATIIIYSSNQNGARITYAPLATITTLFGLMALIAGVIVYQRGYRPARFYLIGWSVYFSGIMSITLILFGVIPSNVWTNNYYLFSVTAELVFMSFALSDRYNIIQQQKLILNNSLESKTSTLKTVSEENQEQQKYKESLVEDLKSILDKPNQLKENLLSIIEDLRPQSQSVQTDSKSETVETSEFIEKLRNLFPELTQGELEICGLLKIRYGTKDIASFRSTTEGAVKVAKTRIKKKLKIEGKLDDYLDSL